MSQKDDRQLAELLLRDGDGNPQEFLSDLITNADGSQSFVVGRRDTGECYRHTIKTIFVEQKGGEFLEVK